MKKYLEAIITERRWSKEAMEGVLSFQERFVREADCKEVLEKWTAAYRENVNIDYQQANKEITEVAQKTKLGVYEALLLLYLSFSRWLPKHYQKAGLPLDVCYNSLDDLKYKAEECYKVYGVWGSFVAFWFPEFFRLERFALGRMQFELINLSREYQKILKSRGKEKNIVLNTHIPSSGRLDHDSCVRSYEMATEFWERFFGQKSPTFFCDSWLLYPEHEKFLPVNSNILRFQRDYDIVQVITDKSGGDLWRIFNCQFDGNIEKLPENTSLQRAYKKWLAEGNFAGYGKGFCFSYLSGSS